MKLRLSLIIPIYNVERYVEKCLRSLEDQDIPKNDYELICINDGSQDASKEVVAGLQKEFDNIILIDQENQGVSRARNNGIDRANGKYTLFVDPDDYIDTMSFGRILKNVDAANAQVSFLGFTIVNEAGQIIKSVLNEANTNQIYPGTEAYFVSRGDGSTDPDRMWAILFKTEFLNHNNLRYLADVPYLEDGEFIARILCTAQSCIFDGHSFYQRTTRPGSATHSELFHLGKANKGFLLAAGNLKRFQEGQKLNENQGKFLNQPIAKFVLLAINSSIGRRKHALFIATANNLKILGLKKIKLNGCNRLFRVLGFSYNLSPYLGAFALIAYPRINKFYRFFNHKF